MNNVNKLLSDSHGKLNSIICLLKPSIQNSNLGVDFDVEYAAMCLNLIHSSFIEVSQLIVSRLPFEERKKFDDILLK